MVYYSGETYMTVRSTRSLSLFSRRRSLLVFVLAVCAGLSAAGAQEMVEMSPDTLVPDAMGVRDVEVSRFGTFVAVYDLSEGNTIRMFNSNLEQLWRRRLPYYWSGSLDSGSVLQFAPDESYVLFPGGRTESDICVCDPASGEPIDMLQDHEESPGVLALSPDGRWLFTASHKELILWERTESTFEPRDVTREYGPYVHSAEFLPDSNRVAVSTTEQMVRTLTVYDVTAGDLSEVFRFQLRDNNISHDMDQIAISPDGTRLATGYRERIFLFSVTDSEIQRESDIEDIDVGTVESLVFSPGGEYLVSGHYGFVKWWTIEAGAWTEVMTVPTQQPVLHDLEMSQDGTHLFLGTRADENALARFVVDGPRPSATGAIIATIDGTLSAAQRRVLTPARAADIVAAIGNDAVAPRDMFETADEYNQRIGAAATAMRNSILDAVEEAYDVERLDGGVVSDVAIPLQGQGSYDVDRSRYSVRLMDTDGWLTIERDAARDLYRGWTAARVVATRFAREGNPAYADFRLIHPDGATAYPIVIEQNPFTGERLNPARTLLPAAAIGPDVLLRELEIDGIFPALYAQYAEKPLGRFIVENIGTGIVSDLRASFSVGGLTAETRPVDLPRSLNAGQAVTAELVAPISSDVLDSTDGGTATLTLTVSYRRGESHSTDITRQIRILNRNAIQWADDRRLGAFMTVSNPVVLSWGGETAGSVTSSPTPVLTRNFLYAMQLYQSLGVAGIQYVVDPNSAYQSLSGDRAAVDFLRFPAETLTQGAGDCDDLSVLYATLLESVGVPTAFITTPGHIFVAYDTGTPESEARLLFAERDNLIYHDGKAWMPIETTILGEGFTRAWQTGALQWRQANEDGTAGFFTTQDAWSEHSPVTPSLSVAPPEPDINLIQSSVRRELDAFREIELDPRLSRLSDARSGATPAVLNQRGILYATYGLLEKASEQFEQALTDNEYVPALINQANVLSVTGRHSDARAYLERARLVSPDNPRILMGLAFSYWESGDQEEARDTYALASRASPSLARRFPLFATNAGDSGSRAGTADTVFNLDWVAD